MFIMRVRDGLIVESRDYIDHMAHVRALANRPATPEQAGRDLVRRADTP